MDNISDDKIINDNATNNGSNNNTVISRRLEAVRGIMKEKGVDIYVVVTGDYHISEYAGDYFKEREFISGFSGSVTLQCFSQMADILCRLRNSLAVQSISL